MALTITSTAFKDGDMIPSQYTCDGRDISPPLAWSGVPEGTRTLALIGDDPDAPGKVWVHWVVFDLPASATGLPEGVPGRGSITGGGTQGKNDFGKTGYGGPCPPSGTHRYYFKLYALDTTLGLPSGATKQQVLDAMKGHVKGEAQLIGKYARR